MESLGDIVEITDAEGVFLYVNPAFERLTGWSSAEALGKTAHDLLRSNVHPDHYFEEIWETITGGRVWRGRLVSRRRDGTLLHQDAQISPVIENGRPTHFVAVKRDVSERIELQAQLRQIERLAAGVAHQINNPLTAVIGNVGLVEDALDESTDAMAMSALRDIRHAGRRIRDVVKQLRDFGREMDEEITNVDVRPVLDFCLEMVETLADERARVHRDYRGVPLIPASRSRLTQLFQQLLLNACQAIPPGMPSNHRIVVKVEKGPSRGVVVSITDSGEGIAKEIREQIFSPFFTTREATGRVGLGLSICLRLVDQLGGTIDYEHLDPGTQVVVKLPGIRRPGPSSSGTITSPTGQRFGDGGREPMRVLIVDDDTLVLRMTQFALREHTVVAAESGHAALEHLEADARFDIILCDLMMSGMSGMEFFGEMSARWPELRPRTVFITGGATIPEIRAFLHGTDNIAFNKPFTGRQLQAFVAHWTEPGAKKNPPQS